MRALALALLGGAAAAPPGFVARNGSTLLLDGAPFRFAGLNIFWMGLAQNANTQPAAFAIVYPAHEVIADALETAAGMGVTFVRSHTLGISCSNLTTFNNYGTAWPFATWPLGTFNDSALDAADYAIYTAERLGIKLQIPLVDDYRYYHGGKHFFTEGCGQADENAFYWDPCSIAAFKQYIQRRLLHVNAYTGRRAVDEPAIAIWESGNELWTAPANWTADIAAFIKSLDPNHLFMDGHYGIDAAVLQEPLVDILSNHFYPVNIGQLWGDAAKAAAAGKAYIAGEFDWSCSTGGNATYLAAFLRAVQNLTAVSGASPWSLFPHALDYGFISHGTMDIHYPGDASRADMIAFETEFIAHAATMRGLPGPPPPPAPGTPVITSINSTLGTVAWRGAALAATYNLQTAPAAAPNSWATLCTACADDNQTPFGVPGGSHALTPGTWVRVQAVGLQGALGNWSAPVQA